MQKQQNLEQMKPAYIENILIWMVMFIGFVSLFFFVINYASIVKVKDNMNAMADYAANIKATDETITDVELITNLNNMKANAVTTLVVGDIVCNSVTDTPATYQVSVSVQTAAGTEYKFYTDQIVAKRVVFNEINSDTVTCTLSITLN